MQPDDWRDVVRNLDSACTPSGFDLVQPFVVDWFNDAVEREQRLPDFGRSRRLAVVIGNTRAFWPHFVDAFRGDPAVRRSAHPVQEYTEREIGSALAGLGARCEVRWSHGPPPFVPMQRLAQIAGLAYLGPGRVCVHPRYGPWIGLRAVVVFDVEGPAGEPPRMSNPCDACASACEPALARALSGAHDWRLWVAVRDACPLGREHRYPEEQIEYHYTKDLAALRRSLSDARGES